ncbi:membrane-associated phospholipase C2 PlcB [Mycobacterium bohemicum DSM 44277]|uniref:Membrane-associated phospholipase C2 PlcB n=1 Tax=Mycobacterium bohemicum DSM 44277 TaxID=1236609 RepID=A0A0U0W9U4_MYCBE|nr:alkaline phosphatase family protein [Mycobacterium bohemicum]MCV6971903.1 alkaline phosphatase family protein [Mycobacterium bohemicum]CPR11770.1 membrane-associated phospholipase C2 PlcB [Mycobacterium bohemicum DSM 44277]
MAWQRFSVCIAVLGLVAACGHRPATPGAQRATATPIHHLVVVFQENVSFDHYFGTYPHAANTDGQPFTAKPDTPAVDGLTPELLAHNPNAAAPIRLGGPAQQVTCDQDHAYQAEQAAFDGGAMDRFVEHTEGDPCAPPSFNTPGLVMGYYDGNTVTALWNYAQHYALSDNFYNTTFGPSSPGHINLVSGQTHGITTKFMPGGRPFPPLAVIDDTGGGLGTLIDDSQPFGDDCSNRDQVQFAAGNKNIGDLLNAEDIAWGWFQGGFKPTARADGEAECGAQHNIGAALGGTGAAGALAFGTKADYVPHHEPFQYYPSTANPHHLPPSAIDKIGSSDQANHQYDLSDFWAAADAGHLPSVSFLKPPAYENGHAGYSDPLDEQRFVVDTINHLQRLPEWRDMAIVIAYDDSDGWYDHKPSPIVSPSATPQDALNGPGRCGDAATAPVAYQGRCGYGPRLPLLVISPYARANFVDHTLTDQTSILRFIEDNWSTGRIGDHSLDERAGALGAMFDFTGPLQPGLSLDAGTGNPR